MTPCHANLNHLFVEKYAFSHDSDSEPLISLSKEFASCLLSQAFLPRKLGTSCLDILPRSGGSRTRICRISTSFASPSSQPLLPLLPLLLVPPLCHHDPEKLLLRQPQLPGVPLQILVVLPVQSLHELTVQRINAKSFFKLRSQSSHFSGWPRFQTFPTMILTLPDEVRQVL